MSESKGEAAPAAGSAATGPIVAVTGASGFIAGHVIKLLQAKGYRVRGTVRSLSNADRVKHLQEDFPGLELFEADLLADGSFDKCIAGADYVLHTASPFQIAVEDPERDLIAPALQGTRNVLASVKKAGGCVKRVVVTSSCAAVTAQDPPEDKSYVWTEADWNTTSTLENGAYRLSKSLAERAAWDWVEAEQKEGSSVTLVTINPSFVLGPPLSERTDGTSVAFCKWALDGSLAASGGANGTCFGAVDVRDIAAAHVAAIEKPEASGRYICSSEAGVSGLEMCTMLREAPDGEFAAYDIPTTEKSAPAYRPLYSHKKAETELGITFTPVETAIRDMARALIATGMVPKKE